MLGSLLATSSIAFPSKASAAQELESINLGCTQTLRTILRQRSPDYCRSTEADSGILFDQFKVTRNSDRSVKLEFRVFNRGSADGLVEVYNSGGSLQDIKVIDGNRPPTGLIQSGSDLFTRVPASFFSRYPLGDARRDLKEQNVTVTIPAGGSVKITKSSNFALWYNTAMLAVEVSQLAQGDPEFTKSETTKQLVRGFAKEFGTQASINVFKGEPSLQSAFSLDFIDKNKLAEILQRLVQYTATVEDDPSKNPILGAFSDVYSTGGNYGLETAIDKYIFPGLGTLAKAVRIGGNGVNVAARAADLSNSRMLGQKATVTLRDVIKAASLPNLPVWESFVLGMRNGTLPYRDYFGADYDLPIEFRRGFVYKVQGANWIGYYVLKSGLFNYPSPTSGLDQISQDTGERYLKAGQAIYFFRGLGNSAFNTYGHDNNVRFPEKGKGCLRTTCLTAPFMTDPQIGRILLSEKKLY